MDDEGKDAGLPDGRTNGASCSSEGIRPSQPGVTQGGRAHRRAQLAKRRAVSHGHVLSTVAPLS